MRPPLFAALRMVPVLVAVALLGSCVHEFPEPTTTGEFRLRLTFSTDMLPYDTTAAIYTSGAARRAAMKGVVASGTMRYIIKLYRQADVKGSGGTALRAETLRRPVREYTLTRDVAEGYDTEFSLKAPAGDYAVLVWADLAESGGRRYYDASDFAAIALQGDHTGSTDHRDAFRGMARLELTEKIEEQPVPTVDVAMERPLAKYEFVSTDLREFLGMAAAAAAAHEAAAKAKAPTDSAAPAAAPVRTVNLDDYRVEFRYVGFMPSVYSMASDRPTDSSTGVTFKGKITPISTGEASLGFDYAFVNGHESAVTVRIALYYADGGGLISLSDPVSVPLRRSHHTVVRGRFLTQRATGGVGIDPSFAGDHNIVLRTMYKDTIMSTISINNQISNPPKSN